jgi:hypothetical protein
MSPIRLPEGHERELRGNLARATSQKERANLEFKLDMWKVITAPTDIGEEKAHALIRQSLDEKHFELLLDKTGVVETPAPEFETLAVLAKGRLSKELLDRVRPVIRKAARQKVAGGNRGDAAGTGMLPRKRKDGGAAKMKGVPHLEDLNDEDYARLKSATDGTWGYNARDIRGGREYPCRLTMYSGALPSELRAMSELAQQVAEAFQYSWAGERWGAQFAKAGKTPPDFLIKTKDGPTPFTTITCNKSYRTAAHVDKGDLREGFGVMCCLGDFEGCDLVFPRYKTAVRYREGDILLANVHQVHGNTPLLNPDGTIPKVGREPERLVCVFYYQENMDLCEKTAAAEKRFINRERAKKAKAGM